MLEWGLGWGFRVYIHVYQIIINRRLGPHNSPHPAESLSHKIKVKHTWSTHIARKVRAFGDVVAEKR